MAILHDEATVSEGRIHEQGFLAPEPLDRLCDVRRIHPLLEVGEQVVLMGRFAKRAVDKRRSSPIVMVVLKRDHHARALP
jgi:hypothetical protein